jgi:predicted transposase YbfD/YdcC
LAAVVATHWPEEISPEEIQAATLIADVERARGKLLDTLDLSELN